MYQLLLAHMEDFGTENSTCEKRFQIPEDPELRERLKGIQYAMKDFQREYPEALSFSMYGSMVKDTATLESDIDGTLFIDTTPTGDNEFDASILERIESGDYLNSFKSDLQDRLGLVEEQVGKDIKLETISETEVVAAAEIFLLAKELYDEELKMWENSKREVGKTEQGEFFGGQPMYEYEGEQPVVPSLPNKIEAMFNLDVGGGIHKYRRQFLNSLEQLEPNQAEEVCRSIGAYLSFSEGGKRKEMAKLPHSYADFKNRYL